MPFKKLLGALMLGACGEQTEADRYGRACGDSGTLAYDMTVRFVAGDLGNPKNAELRLSKMDTWKSSTSNELARTT